MVRSVTEKVGFEGVGFRDYLGDMQRTGQKYHNKNPRLLRASSSNVEVLYTKDTTKPGETIQ